MYLDLHGAEQACLRISVVTDLVLTAFTDTQLYYAVQGFSVSQGVTRVSEAVQMMQIFEGGVPDDGPSRSQRHTPRSYQDVQLC